MKSMKIRRHRFETFLKEREYKLKKKKKISFPMKKS